MSQRFSTFSAILIWYALVIIVYGAFVRITGSGDGCGEHWPLCKGVLLPVSAPLETFIELFHRAKSGLFGILVVFQYVWARKSFVPTSAVRSCALLTVVFTGVEALIGAKLVLLALVDRDESLGRIIVMSAHLLNTMLLTASLYGVWHYSQRPQESWSPRDLSKEAYTVAVTFFLIAATGAWAALASTLFPSSSLWEGLARDFSGDGHILQRIRILHPTVSLLSIIPIFWAFRRLALDATPLRQHRCQIAKRAFLLQLGLGFVTLITLSPTVLKLTHLALAQLTWIAAVAAILTTTDPIRGKS